MDVRRNNEYAIFAARFNVSPDHAFALPAVFEGAAAKVGRNPRALLAEATYRNNMLGRYLANVVSRVATNQEGDSE